MQEDDGHLVTVYGRERSRADIDEAAREAEWAPFTKRWMARWTVMLPQSDSDDLLTAGAVERFSEARASAGFIQTSSRFTITALRAAGFLDELLEGDAAGRIEPGSAWKFRGLSPCFACGRRGSSAAAHSSRSNRKYLFDARDR
jgi:hypothetical protein